MALIYLLRHAESLANSEGILAGRVTGVHLSDRGRLQSRQLVKGLAKLDIRKIYSSPLERCLETISPYSKAVGKRVNFDKNFVEMDYGSWSGRKLASLRREKLWSRIQKKPSSVRFPEGESFTEMSRRIQIGLNSLSRRHRKGGVLVVSHGDPIKFAIAATLGLKIDDFQKIVVDPASLTIIDWKNRTLIAANVPLTEKKASSKSKKASLRKRRILGGGTNV